MRGLIDGMLLFLNNNQVGNYSRSIIDNLIKYNDMDLKIIKDYEIKSNLYPNHRIELLIDRLNDNFDKISKYMINNNISFFHCLNNGFSIPKNEEFNYIMNACNLLPFKYEDCCNEQYLDNFFNKFPYGVLKSEYIICPSVSSKSDFLKEFSINPDNIFVNYGIISDFYKKTDKFMSLTYIKSKFNIDYEYIIFFGDFNKRKSLESALILFSQIRKEYPNLHFIIGSNDFRDKDYLKKLKDLAKDLGLSDYVIFISNLTSLDKANLFNRSIFFIDLSIYENTNLNIVEAFSCEVPIICSEIDLYKEYFGDLCFYYNDKTDYNTVINYIKNFNLHNKDYVLDKFDRILNLEIISSIYKKFS